VSEQLCDVGRGITLCYETFGSRSDEPVLLIMGLGTQMLGWHEDFCEQLADRGFFVVRFDNRDVGHSTHVKGRPPSIGQLISRRINPVAYDLGDMAEDAVELMRRLEIEPAHVVGASMGGMIAQLVAARYPDSVRSLTSVMSNTGNRWLGQPAFRIYRHLLRQAPREREAFIDHVSGLFALIGSRGLDNDAERMREIIGRSYDRDHDAAGQGRQLAALIASGDRTRELRKIKTPALVIHGTDDRMVMPSGGRATARAIPGARLLMVKGMGHDLPSAAWPQLIDAISDHCRAASPAGRGFAATA
jgi:pimeloyl-ACP methyl ester carboxylesterase